MHEAVVPERPRLVVFPAKAIFLPCGRSSTQLMRDSLGRRDEVVCRTVCRSML